MSRVPLGKVLLRNVIRHTDAHNKIQEESEMWKIREMEKQSQEIHWGTDQRTLLNSSSSRMRSDGFDEDSQQATCRTRNMPVMAVTIEDDLRHARYWNKKLYECEANMPDRWGHSGYKELYPEEFDTESDREPDEQNSVNGKRKSQSDKPSSAKLHKRKKAKKSHKKKQKKKSHKKKKKKKREMGVASSQESECSEGEPPKRKKKRHAKSKKASEGPPASSLDPGSGSSKASSCLSSHSGESDSEEPARKRRKRQASLSERAGDRVPEKRSKRKNWKVAADENSEDSSEED
ncbi:uncharacterized protein NKAPD1 [Pituophis catenifer annectens]|uniref:uncharacterized protein NKAPD1 n=1 Tax=Pituophis catenifer annectens TaxID=94852 RepID=UPI00399630AD